MKETFNYLSGANFCDKKDFIISLLKRKINSFKEYDSERKKHYAGLEQKIGEMFMTAIFMSFSRNGKRSRKRKTEITGKYNRKALADGWIEQARRRKE